MKSIFEIKIKPDEKFFKFQIYRGCKQLYFDKIPSNIFLINEIKKHEKEFQKEEKKLNIKRSKYSKVEHKKFMTAILKLAKLPLPIPSSWADVGSSIKFHKKLGYVSIAEIDIIKVI